VVGCLFLAPGSIALGWSPMTLCYIFVRRVLNFFQTQLSLL
jgi:hypothetical protein